ncbi:MAG: hypothetical protein ACM3YN_07155 [Parcubacteria group bacterium]
MKSTLGPHERYLVVRAKNGWSVNLGADQLQFFDNRASARDEAQRLVDEATANGRSADWLDVAEDHSEGAA